MQSTNAKRVGILRGGTGGHYTSSLDKGGEILAHIFENLSDKYKTVDILIDKDGVWHVNGMPVVPADLLHKVDMIWNTAEPNFSVILDNLSIPHISNDSFAYALEHTRDTLREHVKNIGIAMPRSMLLPVYQKGFDGPRERYAIKKAKEVHGKFGAPWIVKSLTPDPGMAIHVAKTFPELVDAIEDGVKHKKSILVQELIGDKVASIHSMAGFRGEEVYTFPLVNASTNFSSIQKEQLGSLAKDLHRHIGATYYLKSDFVLNSRGKVYLTGVQLTPDLKPGSDFSQACELVGTKMHDAIYHILESTLRL